MNTELGRIRTFNLMLTAGAVLFAGGQAAHSAPRAVEIREARPAAAPTSDACFTPVTGEATTNKVSFGASCAPGSITLDPLFHYNPTTDSLGVGTATPGGARVHAVRGDAGFSVRADNTKPPSLAGGNATGIRVENFASVYCPLDEVPNPDFSCPSGGAPPTGSVALRSRAFAQLGVGVLANSNAAAAGAWYDTEGLGVGGTGKFIGGIFGTNGTTCDLFQPFPLSTGLYTVNQQAGLSQTFVGLWAGLDAACLTGTDYKILGPGTVSTVVNDGDRRAVMFAPEAPEPVFHDYGQGQLVNGRAHVQIDPILAQNIAVNDKHPLRVFVQLEGDCNGVYVTNKTANGFDVVELAGGRSNTPFQYQLTANRRDEQRPGGITSLYQDLRFPTAPTTRMMQTDGW